MAPTELGRYAEAIEDFDQSLLLDPEHPFAEADRQAAAELAGSDGTV